MYYGASGSKQAHVSMAKRRSCLSVETFKAHAAEDVLKIALKELRWKNVTSTSSAASKQSCDIYWRGLDQDTTPIPKESYVASMITTCTFPLALHITLCTGMCVIAHKDELSKHINRLREYFPDEFGFYPRTWLLPMEQEKFEAYAYKKKEHGKTSTFIVKPDEGAQGEGIFLIQNPRDLCHLKVPSIVQEYISKPLLIRGLKFDLRLYALVCSLDPLEVYLSQSGMGRFCTVPYQAPNVTNMHKTFMHLTNYSLNKRSKDYAHSDTGDVGNKQTRTSVFRDLKTNGHNTDELWKKIGEVVCKTIIAVLPQLIVEEKAYMAENALTAPFKGFQVLGFDILVDHKLNPHLLEVNAYPSLRVDFEQQVRPGVAEYVPSAVDMSIKLPVVKDTLRIIGAKLMCLDDPCLGTFTELLPSKVEEYCHLRLFERCAKLFTHFVGARGGVRMGSTAFRTFARVCKICGGQFTTADVDILFITVARQHCGAHEKNCLSLHGFSEALLHMTKKINGDTSLGALNTLLEHCESRLKH